MASEAEDAIRAARRIDAERTAVEAEIASLLPLLGPAGMTGPLVDGKFPNPVTPHSPVSYTLPSCRQQRRATLGQTSTYILFVRPDSG